MNPKAEQIRIRYLYRSMVLKGKLRLPLDAARKIVGPDCAYHLYGYTGSGEEQSRNNPRRGKRK